VEEERGKRKTKTKKRVEEEEEVGKVDTREKEEEEEILLDYLTSREQDTEVDRVGWLFRGF
jgi:hypothetical protein